MKIYRKLGFVESFCAILQDKLQGGLLTVMTAEIDLIIPEDIIKKVFTIVYQQDPLLRVRLEQKDDLYYFAQSEHEEAIPYQIEMADKDFDINKATEVELNRPLNSAEHCWRARVIYREDQKTFLMFAVNHAIGDGTSIANFVCRFIDYCNKLFSQEEIPVRSYSILSPLEQMLAKVNSEPGKNIAIDQSQQQLAWKFTRPVPLAQRTARIYTFNRPISFIEKLHQLAHAQRTTINSALLTAIFQTVVNDFPQIPAICVVPEDIDPVVDLHSPTNN